MSTINIVFQEKGNNNRIIKGKTNVAFSELIQSYYKNICASKKDKMTKIFVFNGSEHSPEESSTLNELGLHDYSVIVVQSNEKTTIGSYKPPKKQEPQKVEPQEKPTQPKEEPQEEELQKEEHQEEQEQEEHQEEPEQEEHQEEPEQEEHQEESPLNQFMNNPLFAPLLSKEHIQRHECEFKFIPNLLPVLYSGGIVTDEIMTNPSTWRQFLNPMIHIDPSFFDELSVEKKELENGTIKFIITFPKPKVGTECFFAILYFDGEKNSNYFTLELELGKDFGSTEGTGLICGQDGSKHLNFNRVCKADKEDFENAVEEIYNEG